MWQTHETKMENHAKLCNSNQRMFAKRRLAAVHGMYVTVNLDDLFFSSKCVLRCVCVCVCVCVGVYYTVTRG
jgi:hypothetical protein